MSGVIATLITTRNRSICAEKSVSIKTASCFADYLNISPYHTICCCFALKAFDSGNTKIGYTMALESHV